MATNQSRGGRSAKRTKREFVLANNAEDSDGAPNLPASSEVLAVYHEMKRTEDFDDTADMIFQMVRDCALKNPSRPRYLYLDIEGHRNEAGGFDSDAYELIVNFVHGFLMQWLTETHTPLGAYKNRSQREDIPDGLHIISGGDPTSREETLRESAEALGQPVYDAETGEMFGIDNGRRFRD